MHKINTNWMSESSLWEKLIHRCISVPNCRHGWLPLSVLWVL